MRDSLLVLGVDLSNPATPWVVLALTAGAWLAVYLFVSAEPRP